MLYVNKYLILFMKSLYNRIVEALHGAGFINIASKKFDFAQGMRNEAYKQLGE